ncbi:MAG: hypothetical protein KJZ87_15940 [Thermoguttaceae bacterium]|nr:hypothetical protein [Thermoguttaceae bacterium]
MRIAMKCVMLLTLAGVVGCGGSAASIPISGEVTYNGEPVKAVNVVFVGATADQIYTATTDDQGRFSGVKAAAGEYKVAITQRTDAATEGTISYDAPGPPPFPAKYTSIDGSGLKATVEKGGANNFNFAMTD